MQEWVTELRVHVHALCEVSDTLLHTKQKAKIYVYMQLNLEPTTCMFMYMYNVHVHVHCMLMDSSILVYMYMIKSMRPIQYKTRQHNNTT